MTQCPVYARDDRMSSVCYGWPNVQCMLGMNQCPEYARDDPMSSVCYWPLFKWRNNIITMYELNYFKQQGVIMKTLSAHLMAKSSVPNIKDACGDSLDYADPVATYIFRHTLMQTKSLSARSLLKFSFFSSAPVFRPQIFLELHTSAPWPWSHPSSCLPQSWSAARWFPLCPWGRNGA